jgi:uncharacterized protein YjbI with pentapeptide repeats
LATERDVPSVDGWSVKLAADCERCSGLCCVAPAFSASADFGFDKPAGLPCHHLLPSLRCGIHTHLRSDGMRGCAVYDCFGAGQRVTQVTFAGADWRTAPHLAGQVFRTFAVMRQLHELLWYLTAALSMPISSALRHEVHVARDTIEQLTMLDADSLGTLGVDAHRNEANTVLLAVSEHVRAGVGPAAQDRRGADLIGASLPAANLTRANLRGALLIGANLTAADLTLADVTGADVRDTDFSGANLAYSLFLTQAQLEAAKGDTRTRLPITLDRPRHWQRAS